MSFFKSPQSAWQRYNLSQVLSPDANGATLDSQGLLSGPIVEVAPGIFDIPLLGGVAKTDPKDGAVLVFQSQDGIGNIANQSPMAVLGKLDIVTPPAASSGVVIAVGIAQDATLGTTVYGGIDYDTSPRTRAGAGGSYAVSGTTAGANQAQWSQSFTSTTSTSTDVEAIDGRTALLNSSGVRVRHGARDNLVVFTGPCFTFLSIYGSKSLSAVTIRVDMQSYYAELPGGLSL